MIEHVLDLGNQLKKELETSTDFAIDSYNDLLIVGMGGSGVAGDVLKLVLNENTQIIDKLKIFFDIYKNNYDEVFILTPKNFYFFCHVM